LRLEDPPHDVDRGVVAVEHAGGGDEPDRVNGGVERGRRSHACRILGHPTICPPSVGRPKMYPGEMAAKRRLPFDPIDEARRHWEGRWGRGDAMAAATAVMRAQQIVLGAVD